MGKYINDIAQDALLDWIADNGNVIHLCTNQPTDYTEASSPDSGAGFSLGSYTLTAGTGGGDFAITNGTGTSGRKLRVGGQVESVSISEAGSVTHIAMTNGSDTLAFVTTIPAKVVLAASNVNIGVWTIELPDPV